MARSLVSWSSWLWHLLNTQNVPSSILGEISYFFVFHFGNMEPPSLLAELGTFISCCGPTPQ